MKILCRIVFLIALQANVAMASPDVEVRKSVSNPIAMLNEPVEFTIQVNNIGTELAPDVLIVDQLPAEMQIPTGLAAFPSIGSYDAASGEWSIGDMVVGAGATLVIPAVVMDPQPPQCIVNSARSEPGDIHTDNNEARAAIYQNTVYRCVDVTANPNIFAGTSVFPTCDSEESHTGTIEVRNFGPDAARNVDISLTQTPIIGANIRFDDTQCVQSGLDVCTVIEIPAGQSASLNVTSDVFQNYTETDYRLTLSASTSDVDYAPDNNLFEADIPVRGFSSCQEIETSMAVASGSSACFIATAAYGSSLHPRLQSLRSFRDRFLLSNRPGRQFVKFYYQHSPALAEFIANRDWLRAIVRGLLAPVVGTIDHPGPATLLLFGLAASARVWRRRVRRLSNSSTEEVTRSSS